jgi:SAM-dependent methyltransferase
MLRNPEEPLPSLWVRRFLPLIPAGLVLDLAAGGGRHTRFLLAAGSTVRAVDRDVSALLPLEGPACEVLRLDLEAGGPWPLGGGYAGIVATNYLHRPLLPSLAGALMPNGILIYETFALGNERLGRPRNPEFLLRPGELIAAFAALTIIAFEEGEVAAPRPAVVQRIACRAGPPGLLPPTPPPASGVRTAA